MNFSIYRQFARDLVTTGELDPLYTMLYRARAEKGDEWVKLFCMYMLMFYDSKGAYEEATTGEVGFWERIRQDFDTRRRGKERRHFRGENGRVSFISLQALGSPVAAFDIIAHTRTIPTANTVLNSAGVMGFGEYFRLKWVDYQAKVMLVPFNYSHLPFMLPESPMKCIKQVWPDTHPTVAMENIVGWIDDLPDPFSGTTMCGNSEAETIACAIPSYLIKGNYKMGDDIAKYHAELKDYPELVRLLPAKV